MKNKQKLFWIAGAVAVFTVITALLAVNLGLIGKQSGQKPKSAAKRNDAYSQPLKLKTSNSFMETIAIGRSVKGRPIKLIRLGKGDKRVLFIASTHGNEDGGHVIDQFVNYLDKNRSAIPPGTEVDIIPRINPDGAAKKHRGNAHNVDLNRNLPVEWTHDVDPKDDSGVFGNNAGEKPASEPETKALMRALETRYVRIISLHSFGGIFDYDGPGGKALAIAMAYATGPAYLADANSTPDKGTSSGSLGHYAPKTYNIPVVTVELNHDSIDDILPGLLLAIKY